MAGETKICGPILLHSHQLGQRFYLGGPQISSFRGEERASESEAHSRREPEDWVASTTCCAGHDSLGLTRLGQTDTLLVDEIGADPVAWLGSAHVAKYGSDTKLLVKLLDAGQRLPIHAHPHVDWARMHLARNHGKAEAWHMLTGGDVYLGLKEHVTAARLLDMVDAQDIQAMLQLLHRVEVQRGDTVYVPPGMLHAIGQGILLVEVQEPEDMSILLEWSHFQLDGRKHGHLGLGFAKAITAIDTSALSHEQLDQLVVRAQTSTTSNLLSEHALEYFRMDKFYSDVELDAGFQVVVVLSGEVEVSVRSTDQAAVILKGGSTALLRHADGSVAFKVRQPTEFLVIRPPL
ncbi:uncharacterized protein UMAG_06454 [Mycosarcoma maydis]|uniref:Mannose-6-phosphate isomerase n=1 Tax=Mycosarcoma maydis TaxID=5270 RepID=A0A0D1DNW5_MYCMD|nr:uncharacterized protein UMAG_06454 [Ustilago maydis 521]KIS65751.1 hypothetical protein UMAG_06454 [Ustilago maydis 521]|eukprot:XP_011392723.1 hypothetical protein UMAG_06454 [Ustilago maydis 521]